jgi:hypothetical protein
MEVAMVAAPRARVDYESFHSQHAPLGAFATFTIGLVGSPGGFGHALRGPARQNVYVGFRAGRTSPWRLLPFCTAAPESDEGAFTGEASTAGPEAKLLRPTEYHRVLGWASDTWRADKDRFGFTLLSPFGPTGDPVRMNRSAARLAFSPHINGWLEYDNRQGTTAVELVFGVGDPDSIFHPLTDSGLALPGFALGTQFAYATAPSNDVEMRQGFDVFAPKYRDFRGLCVLGGESALAFRVPAGAKRRFPLVLAFFQQGIVTTGRPALYAYTRSFRDVEDVVAHGLGERKHYETLAATRDRELAAARLSDDQKFLIAQATHSYLASTQLLCDDKEFVWVVNEGEYRMMNTFDLTVDHLFFELRHFPWTVRNTLDLFAQRYSYADEIRPADGRAVKGGLSFTHDMGVLNAFAPRGHSSYECDHLRGCFSHMTMEQLLNWVLCAATYGIHTRDVAWLRKHEKTLRTCAESLRRRDNPDPAQRDGILKCDSLRCGTDGAEITTYDSLDASLGQARSNLYLTVKALGAWIVLEEALSLLGLHAEAKAAARSADLVVQALIGKFDEKSGTFPAVFEGGNRSRIIPAVEGLAYPVFLGLVSVARPGRFSTLLDLLGRHLKAILRPGICIDASSGAWKMSSTSTNTWFSKIALAQFVVRRLFPDALSAAAKRADRVHARWQRLPACGAFAMCDQIRSDTGIPCGSRYYPRGVTSVLWMAERDLLRPPTSRVQTGPAGGRLVRTRGR